MLEHSEHNWIAGAVEALAGGANVSEETSAELPRQKIGRATGLTKTAQWSPSHPIQQAATLSQTTGNAPAEPNSPAPFNRRAPGTSRAGEPNSVLPTGRHNPLRARGTEPELDGQRGADTQITHAIQPSFGGGQYQTYTHPVSAPAEDPHINLIVERWRVRMDMMRARLRLELQAQAVCRRACDGDKVEGAKLWAKVKADPEHPIRGWIAPFMLAMVPLDAAQNDIEKELKRIVRKLPIAAWAKGVLGLGEVSLAGIIGEARIGPGEYRTVSGLWKRMGMAVINGGRQRRVTGGEALEHGYSAERRSLMWNIGGCIIKAQVRNIKGDDGKKTEGTDFAIGELGQVYLDRKAYMRAKNEAGEYAERAAAMVVSAKRAGSIPNKDNLAGHLTAAHIHNDAKRYIEKRLLRQLWQAWRQATCWTTTIAGPPASNNSEVVS